ncbi:MAG: PQQ-dependent dehydrogenase, methanol/ethanol family, partial [Pseudomonadota bacterium]
LRKAFASSVLYTLLSGLAYAENISVDQIKKITSEINTNSIIENDKSDKNWLSYGLNYSETRFSDLNKIDTENVGQLGLSWSTSLDSRRGVEASPIVIDGVMYVTSSWSIVHALDAKSGKELWRYDPQVPPEHGEKGCCDVVNRGVAVYEGKVFVGAFDGYLHAIDAATGEQIWKTDTLIDRTKAYTITGAPRVYNGKVMIGNGGAEYGVRGYISAFDANTGEMAWRWYSVPGDPSKPQEKPELEEAAKTWDPSGEYWKAGGGGTIWDAMAFDPELNTMYVGVGNGSPWSQKVRSPGGGDNLYLSSVVALNPDTGEYKCHYQTVPGDTWDYTATQHIILSDLEIDGKTRKVFMQAPKSGFFYVVDREDCSFISAEPFVEVTWATGFDENGRAIVAEGARYLDGPFEAIPSAYGAHNWHPMSYNPQTGLVYIPAQGVPLSYENDPNWKLDEHVPGQAMSNVGWNLGVLFNTVPPKATPFGHLVAWDPVKQKEVWRSEYVSPWNGGTLTTAGNLVFQGTADGRFIAYNAETGAPLWQTPVGTGAVAAPVTWELDGKQYVTIAVGWGGVYGQLQRATEKTGPGRVFTFAVGDSATMPEFIEREPAELVAGVPYDPNHVGDGAALYVSSCLFCHGVPGVNNGGNIPNLGYSQKATIENLGDFVLTNALIEGGMPNFEGKLSKDDISKLVAFIQGTADAVRPK